MNKHYRHGDILLIKIDKLPENMKFKIRRSNIILKGEVTGHAHRLEGNAKILEIAERIANPGFKLANGVEITTGPITIPINQVRTQTIGYAVVDSPTELTHEEHNTITIPTGIYQIKRQREYDAEYIRFVED